MSKKKQKSMEELLEEALVPEEEQPYPVPENWVWTRLGNVVDFINGDRGKGYPSKKDFVQHGIPFINAGHLENGNINMEKMNYISNEKYDSLRSGKVINNDVLYCLRGTLGKAAIVRGIDKGAIASSLVILRPNNDVNNSYLYFYLISGLGKSMIEIHDNGSAQPNLSVNNVKKFIFPLPPKYEQKRIAEKIERLFAKIDEAKRLIEEVKESFELRRTAILDKAFKGQLGTNDPNEKSMLETSNNINEKDLISKEEQPYEVPKNWVWTNINAISSLVVDGSHNPPPKQSEGIPMLSGKNIHNGYINFETDRFVTEEDYKKEYKRTPIEKNDVLLTIVGTIGRSTVVRDFSKPFVLQRSVALIKPNILADFLCYYFQTPYFQHYLQSNAKGTAQKGVYLRTLKTSFVPLPPYNEQKRIAEKVEKLLSKLDNEKEMVLEVEQKLDLIKQSILNKAFRGELGTNDPTEESAIELLKEVLQSK